MKITNILLRDKVQDLVPYPIEDHAYQIKLDANESPFSIDWTEWPDIINEINKISLNRYPDPHARELKIALSDYLNWPADQMILGNGSDELIQYILMAYGGLDRPVYAPHPSFAMYRIISISMGQEFRYIPLGKGFELPANQGLLEELSSPPQKIVFIATPNNPTGNFFNREHLLAIIEHTRGLVCIDEAYHDFCEEEGFLNILPEYENLIILRTLSKIGLAGLRVGILLGNKGVISAISKVRLPFNMNVMSQFLACTVLKRHDLLLDMIRKIRENRTWLTTELEQIPRIQVFPSQANFILFTCEGHTSDIYHDLLKEGVLIRMFPPEGTWPGLMRVTVGTKKECEVFVQILKKVLSTKGNQ